MLKLKTKGRIILSAPVTGSNLLLSNLMRMEYQSEDFDCLDAPSGTPSGALSVARHVRQYCNWNYRQGHLN
jgi:hypothetical protein